MTTVIPLGDGKYRVFTKGASEILINKCSYIVGSDAELHPLSRVDRKNLIRNTVETMAEQGLRTLTLAYKVNKHDKDVLSTLYYNNVGCCRRGNSPRKWRGR